MTKRKKDRNETEAGLSSATGSQTDPSIGVDMGYESREAAPPFPGTSVSGRKSTSGPKQLTVDEVDQHLILTYLAFYRLLERTLVQAGFTTISASYKQPRPDWYRWAWHIEKKFDPNSSEELQSSVEYLLSLQEEREELPGRRQNRFQWESSSPYSDILWLTDMLQQVNIQLTHRYNFSETPGCDTPQVMAALFVAQAWLPLVP